MKRMMVQSVLSVRETSLKKLQEDLYFGSIAMFVVIGLITTVLLVPT